MECLSAKKLPRGEQWTYEIKLDGFRVEALRTADSVILYSKQGKLLTSQFKQVALELEELPSGTAIDGELVALDRDGLPPIQPAPELPQRFSASDVLCVRHPVA